MTHYARVRTWRAVMKNHNEMGHDVDPMLAIGSLWQLKRPTTVLYTTRPITLVDFKTLDLCRAKPSSVFVIVGMPKDCGSIMRVLVDGCIRDVIRDSFLAACRCISNKDRARVYRCGI